MGCRLTTHEAATLGLVPWTEAAFTAEVLRLAREHGWRSMHLRPARTARGWRTAVQGDGIGWPDVTLVRERVIVAELKVGRGQLTPAQRAWLMALALAGVAAYLWRPEDLEEIQGVLR